ncbi:MAG: response regulator [bacterium]|nr:response regulator [bacterium]
MEIKYDIRRGADIYRAIYGARLQKWILAGKIKRGEVIVWRSGLSGWRKAEELEELAPFFEQWEKEQLRETKRQKEQVFLRKKQKKIKNILIIDDEKDLCSLLSDALIQRNYNVSIANTKREAMAYLKKKSPDLVLLDLKLPDGDGIKILPRIKRVNPETVVIVISAYGSEESRQMAKKGGAFTFINKPFTEEDILRSIKVLS